MAGQRTWRAELKGAKELEAALMELPKRIGKAAVRRALLKAGGPIAEDAKARVAVLSGDLKRRIAISTQLSRRQRRSRARGAVKGRVEVFIGTGPARHAHLVEFGTAPRRHKRGKSIGAAPARPFMRPAWEAGKNRALDVFGRLLWIEIEKAAKRLARKQAKANR
jgi:HK97 gp10 family phage protein